MAIRVCPKFAYMHHGSYWSYYAFLIDTNASPCSEQPVSWDAPDYYQFNDLLGHCGAPQFCQSETLIDSKDRSKKTDMGQFLAHSGLKARYLPQSENTMLQYRGDIARPLTSDVKYIEFTRPDNNRRIIAEVCGLYVAPYCSSLNAFEVGHGHELKAAIEYPPDRRQDRGEVSVFAQDGSYVEVDVKLSRRKTLSYQIRLRE